MEPNSTRTAVDPVPAGLTAERVGFFTDAVFAIAMTLLVIEIPRPEDGEFGVGEDVGKAEAARNLGHFLAEQAGSFVAYLLAFYLLWIVWRQHHGLFDRIDRLSPALVRWHFPLLLLVGFLPYSTTVLGHHIDNPAAALLYSLTVGCLLASRSALRSRALSDGLLRDDVDLAGHRRETRASWWVTAYWFATVPLVWWAPWVTIAWSATSAVGALLDRRGRGPAGA
jgi:uncharacterized membrane protein